MQVIQAAAAGNGAVPPDLLGRLLAQVGALQRKVLGPRGLPFAGLADREVEVLRLVADGLDTAEIAAKLSYSPRTIKNVLHDVTSRLHLRNRSHAVAYALRNGLDLRRAALPGSRRAAPSPEPVRTCPAGSAATTVEAADNRGRRRALGKMRWVAVVVPGLLAGPALPTAAEPPPAGPVPSGGRPGRLRLPTRATPAPPVRRCGWPCPARPPVTCWRRPTAVSPTPTPTYATDAIVWVGTARPTARPRR